MEENTELSNIREFLKLQREIELTDKTITRFNQLNRDTSEQLDRKQQLQQALIQRQEALTAIPAEKSSVSKRYGNLKWQLQVILERLVPNHYGHAIDRNQGLILENHIYSTILQDLYEVLSNEFMGVSLPTYYYSASSDFNPNPLKELLSEILAELFAKPVPENFVELHELIISLENRIIAVAKAEYDQNRDKSQVFY